MVSLRGMARSIRGLFAGGRQVSAVDSSDSDLDNRPWLSLVAECVGLYDELDRTRAAFDPPRRAVAEHVCLRLEEILDRAGVERLEGAGAFDRQRHQPETAGITVAPGAVVAETVSPGFAVGRRILRRALVRLD